MEKLTQFFHISSLYDPTAFYNDSSNKPIELCTSRTFLAIFIFDLNNLFSYDLIYASKLVLKISYAEDERYLAEFNMREYRVDNSVNMITLNVYSYADDAIDLRILSKCAKSGGYVESYKTKLNKGWNKVEISVTALNCATLGQLQSLRLQIEKTSDIAIGEILIGG